MSLITIQTAEKDRRKTFLSVTAKGKKKWNDCMCELDELKSKFANPLTSEQLEILLPAMEQLNVLVGYHVEKQTNGE